MKMILTPVDFSAATPAVVAEAGRLAKATEGYVVLLHVARVPLPATGFPVENETLAAVTRAVERAADRRLDELKRVLREDGVPVQALRLTGDPATDIVEQARRLRADYIVIGTRGHSALYDLVVGSTVRAVLKRSNTVVVVVPATVRDPNGLLPHSTPDAAMATR
jgi:nucleotide-binding universal stress UspA family protein